MSIQSNWRALFSATALLAVAVLASGRQVFAAPADNVTFKVDTQTAVPGAVLAPGSYTLHVVNSLSDRVVLKVSGHGVNTTFLGVEQTNMGSTPGVAMWDNAADGVNYARGISFAGSRAPVEFVYSKDDAVKIAQSNPGKVPAVDPGSEGKPADNTISQKDMQLLNLWLLHVDRVGTDGGVKAEHYMPVSATAGAKPQPKARPAVAALPHTGSMMPLVWGAGMLSLIGAFGLRMAGLRDMRRKRDASASA